MRVKMTKIFPGNTMLNYCFYLFSLLFLVSCGQGSEFGTNSTSNNSPDNTQRSPIKGTAKPYSAEILAKDFAFKIPAQQNKGDVIPPQPGQKVFGQTVRGAPNQDTNWSAFVLVLYADGAGGFKVLTQKRATSHAGTIETAGGHLVGGQSWRDGAADELLQEAGIKVENKALVFLQGAEPRQSRSGHLYGNANFFVVFDKEPKTSDKSGEIDQSYGHQWLDLKTVFQEMKTETQNLGFTKHGKYYSFFRGHLNHFCAKVLDCSKL